MKPILHPSLHPQIVAWWKKDLPLEEEATRKGFGEGLAKAKTKKLYALTADLTGSTSLSAFKKKHPERTINVGVAEQSLIGIAAGIASEGNTAVATSFAVFSPGRNWDFIRTQVAMNRLPVIIASSHAGLATGQDGATHQALEDVALMRSLPHMTIISPACANEAIAATHAAITQKSPVYLRLARAKQPILFKKQPFTIGKAKTLIKGGKTTIISTGLSTYHALAAARTLWKDDRKAITVIHAPTIKPLDPSLRKTLNGSKDIITVEDHNIIGGLGSAIAELMAGTKSSSTLTRLGVREAFGSSGNPDELYHEHGIDHESITKTLRKKLYG